MSDTADQLRTLCDSAFPYDPEMQEFVCKAANELEAAISRAEKAERRADELKEQLRPRKYPDEKPEHDQVVIHDGHTYRFDSNGEDPDQWDDGTWLLDCEEGDLWIPLPELVESPPTGEDVDNE